MQAKVGLIDVFEEEGVVMTSEYRERAERQRQLRTMPH
jgi:hypothetical protein